MQIRQNVLDVLLQELERSGEGRLTEIKGKLVVGLREGRGQKRVAVLEMRRSSQSPRDKILWELAEAKCIMDKAGGPAMKKPPYNPRSGSLDLGAERGLYNSN